MKPESKNKKLRVYIPVAVVILIVLLGAIYWYRDYQRYITTDDAHIDADNVSVSSKMLGRISALYAQEGDTVSAGTLMAVLDSTDILAQKEQALALKAQAETGLAQSRIKYSSDQKSLRVLEINLERATDDFTRAKAQSEGGVIPPEQFDHAKKAFETAQAQLEAAKAQLLVSRSMIGSATSAVETANAQVNVLNTQLNNTKLYAPADGIVAKRWLMPGDVVQPSQGIFTLTLSHNLWVVTFLEETKISDVHPGQDVNFTIDAFGDTKFHGKIFLVGSYTASVFSLIPANNASGNFTKVTQRIPVRISIDSADNVRDLSSLKIVSGMSAVVKIIKH
ncbi:MAG TPA: HlyD family secretion protein [Bacteroidales bacterium]|nr:HlyD family secretion protein [Bacteroidales bacterium]